MTNYTDSTDASQHYIAEEHHVTGRHFSQFIVACTGSRILFSINRRYRENRDRCELCVHYFALPTMRIPRDTMSTTARDMLRAHRAKPNAEGVARIFMVYGFTGIASVAKFGRCRNEREFSL